MKNSDSKFIKVISTRKYKDINLYLRFSIENKYLLKEKIALLCKLIGDVSMKYPNKVEMAKARDMLYGIGLIPTYKVRANIITFSLHYSFINPRFVDASINDYNDFIIETLSNTIINENTLKEAKNNLKASLQRRIEKPANEANERFIEIVSKDNDNFAIYSEGKNFIKNIDKINLEDMISTYKYIINSAQLNIYLCGDLKQKDINTLTNYSFKNRKKIKYKFTKIKHQKKNTKIEHKDISQSYVIVAYATPFNKLHKDYFAWFLGNAFLGTLPTSLLFAEVREKLSLCYAISSIDYKNEGLIKVVTSIDAQNKDKTIKAIYRQVDRIKNIDYDLNQLEITKTLLCNSILGIYDDLDSLIDYYYESYISGFNYSIEEYCEKISQVKPKDIARVYKQYSHYFNYVLLGDKHE